MKFNVVVFSGLKHFLVNN